MKKQNIVMVKAPVMILMGIEQIPNPPKCPVCKGTGKIAGTDKPCMECDGTGRR